MARKVGGGCRVNEMEVKFSVNLRILPFGRAVVEMKSGEQVKEEKMERQPVYTEPKTTDIKIVEIIFGGDNYIVPKTTGGLL
jgi:hypothetical protein